MGFETLLGTVRDMAKENAWMKEIECEHGQYDHGAIEDVYDETSVKSLENHPRRCEETRTEIFLGFNDAP